CSLRAAHPPPPALHPFPTRRSSDLFQSAFGQEHRRRHQGRQHRRRHVAQAPPHEGRHGPAPLQADEDDPLGKSHDADDKYEPPDVHLRQTPSTITPATMPARLASRRPRFIGSPAAATTTMVDTPAAATVAGSVSPGMSMLRNTMGITKEKSPPWGAVAP